MRVGVSNCRSCGAPILWTETAATGKRMPVDEDPVPDGNVFLEETPRGLVAHAGKHPPPVVNLITVKLLGERDFGPAKFVSHFGTCPQSKGWRKP
jgi:hypothetical protein